ncbi:MAG: hypothetical protein AB7V32_09515 [Candidatus Berkiella sp.]
MSIYSDLMRVVKRVSKLGAGIMVAFSPVRAKEQDYGNFAVECSGNYSEGFKVQAQSAFINSIYHICDETKQLFENVSFPTPNLLKNFTLFKFTSGTISSVNFETGERKESSFYAQDQHQQEVKIISQGSDRLIAAVSYGHQKDETCGKFMKITCG